MYCAKCKFTSFDYPVACPKCGVEWNALKEKLNLAWISTPGYDWLADGQPDGSRTLDTVSTASEPTESPFAFEDMGKSEPQAASLQELSFDEFEEVNIGVADNDPFALKRNPAAQQDFELEGFQTDPAGDGMPEVSLNDDELADTLLNQEIDDIAGLELDLDELTDASLQKMESKSNTPGDSGDLSLDDLDLELEDLVQEASRKR
jgi:hypothetical protein